MSWVVVFLFCVCYMSQRCELAVREPAANPPSPDWLVSLFKRGQRDPLPVRC